MNTETKLQLEGSRYERIRWWLAVRRIFDLPPPPVLVLARDLNDELGAVHATHSQQDDIANTLCGRTIRFDPNAKPSEPLVFANPACPQCTELWNLSERRERGG